MGKKDKKDGNIYRIQMKATCSENLRAGLENFNTNQNYGI